jgi:hypothetical protein
LAGSLADFFVAGQGAFAVFEVFGCEHQGRLAEEEFIALYEAWNKPEEAEEWRTKLSQIENFDE